MRSQAKLRVLAALTVLAMPLALVPQGASADPETNPVAMSRVLQQYGEDTWKSFLAMVYPETGLPTDHINAQTMEKARYTSPTNIGAYIWSTLAARDIHVISPSEARDRIGQTLNTLSHMERSNGFFYNWYDPATGERLTTWPDGGATVYPFLSTVDNGWLSTALIMVSNSVPQLRDQALALANEMHYNFFYHSDIGLLRGGYWTETPIGQGSAPTVNSTQCVTRNPGDPPFPGYTCFDFGSLNTEPRISSYIGIAMGDMPAQHYFHMWRTFPDTCDWSWQEMKPAGVTRNYLGVDVYEGHYTYRDMNLVPSWGGSMFEALMVDLFVPEEQWGPRSWGTNQPLYVQSQIEHGMQEAGYGYWGFSPSNDPAGGYREYGVDPIGLNPDGYTSDEERTTVDYGFAGCRPAQPPPAHYGQGVVTPHASFLALHLAPQMALENLSNLKTHFDAYGWGGFYDAVNVTSGAISKYYLALDQGMVMAAIGNALRGDRLQDYFTRGAVEQHVRPILQMEEFTASGDVYIR